MAYGDCIFLPVRWELVSLLDMIKINGKGLVHIGHLLGLLNSLAARSPAVTHPVPQSWSVSFPETLGVHTVNISGDSPVKTETKDSKSVNDLFPGMLEWFEQAGKRFDELGLKISAIKVQRIIEQWKEGELSVEEFGRDAGVLAERIEDELAGFLFFQIEKNYELYDAAYPLGEEVAQKLPTALEDSQEAGKCLALGRWTACVFHLMRVMEIGVQKFGDRIGVQLSNEKNWQNILDEVNKAIKTMDQKAAATKEYASLSAHLYNVKLAWRNEVMHPKATYTEQEADDIYRHVRIFMGTAVRIVV